nr:GldG family protein [Saccharofermentans sp.]
MSKENKNKVKTDNRAKTLRFFSIWSVIILIVIVLLANILFDGLLGKALTFDFSMSGNNSISQESVDFINTLPQDAKIRIIGLLDKPENLANSPYQYIVPLLDDYQAKSGGRISVEYINPDVYPSIITQLDPQGVNDLTAGNFVVAYNDKLKVISPYDCFAYDTTQSSSYAMVPTANNVEYSFTNAILQLSKGFSFKAYIVTGLNEEGSVYLTSILESIGCDVASLPVSDSFTVPEDCNLLILNGPNTDISENMSVAIQDYLYNGGDMIVAVNYSQANVTEKFTNLNNALHYVSLNIEDSVIRDNNADYQLESSGFNSLVDINGQILSVNSDLQSFTQFKSSFARPITDFGTPHSYIQKYPVASTSSNAMAVRTDENGQTTDYENEGQYNVAMYGTFDGMVDPPEVMVFGTTNFTSDTYIANFGFNDSNIEFLRAVIRMLLGTDDSDSLEIVSKPLDDYGLDETKVTS